MLCFYKDTSISFNSRPPEEVQRALMETLAHFIHASEPN